MSSVDSALYTHTQTNLLRKLKEEELGQASDPLLLIHDAGRHLADLTFDLDHVVEDEMSEDHQGVLADMGTGITQPGCETAQNVIYK